MDLVQNDFCELHAVSLPHYEQMWKTDAKLTNSTFGKNPDQKTFDFQMGLWQDWCLMSEFKTDG